MANQARDVTDLMRDEFHNGPMSIKARTEKPKFHTLWHDGVQVLSATVDGNNVKVTWRFRVTTEYANPAELLHGAAQALFVSSQCPGSRWIPRRVFDVCIAYLPHPIAKPGFWDDLGFTRNLNINFLRTAKVGEYVIMETELKQIGRTMGYMTGEMRREKDGAIISTCEQNKFNLSTGMKPSKL
ncbi:hypothetical protein Q7P36_004813 [Cladosporium allicinum]